MTDLAHGDDGKIWAHDIEFRELSLVSFPADENAQLIEILNNLKEDQRMKTELSQSPEDSGVDQTKTKQPEKELPPVKPKDEEPVVETGPAEEKPSDAKPLTKQADLLAEGEQMTVDELKSKIDELNKIIAQKDAEIAALKKSKTESKAPAEVDETLALKEKVLELEKKMMTGSRKTQVKAYKATEELMQVSPGVFTKKNPYGMAYGLKDVIRK
jgi:hypothetical protein